MHVVKLPRDEKGPPPWHSEQSGMGKGQDVLEQTPRESVSLEAVVVNWLGPSLFHILYTFDACFIWFFNVFFKGSHYVAQVALRLSIPPPPSLYSWNTRHVSPLWYVLHTLCMIPDKSKYIKGWGKRQRIETTNGPSSISDESWQQSCHLERVAASRTAW